LYWRLADDAGRRGWANLEYGGNWKVTHSQLARRFHDPDFWSLRNRIRTPGMCVLWSGQRDTPDQYR
jgi:hypothetical protein